MKKTELKVLTETYKTQTREALQFLWDGLKVGHRKQLLKKPEMVAIFDRFGVNYKDGEE